VIIYNLPLACLDESLYIERQHWTTLKGTAISTLERVRASSNLLFSEHISRYYFASGFAEGKAILDFGCGEGYGSKILKKRARSVIALDISIDAALITREQSKIPVVQADARNAPFRSQTFDLIVSFEVFEHITRVEDYLYEAHRLLKPGGCLIISTPNVDYYPQAGMNPFHVKEYSSIEVMNLLKDADFTNQKVFAQIPAKKEIIKLQKSKLLLTIMKLKRLFGFHGDLLPVFLQRAIKRAIAGGDVTKFNLDDYQYIENKFNEPELIYVAYR